MTVEEAWGRLRVLVWPEGSLRTDVTFFRAVPAEPLSWTYADPFSDETAVIRFPQITPFEVPGSGDLTWIDEHANLELQRVHPDGTTTTTIWEGLVEDWQVDQDGRSGSLTVTNKGSLFQSKDFVRAPKGNRNADTLEVIEGNEFSTAQTNRPSLRTRPIIVTGGPTGVEFVNRPAWLDSASFQFETLARSVISATDQWTVQKVAPRTPNLIRKSARGTTRTLTVGTPGLTLQGMHQDWASTYNVIYAEGVDTFGGGGKWRNFFLKPEEFFQPIAYTTDVHPHDEDGVGGLSTDFARVDPTKRRRERFMNFGEGTSKEEARTICEYLVARDSDPGWMGTLELKIDPEECSRFDLRDGDRIKLKHFAGSGATGVTFHIAHVAVDWPGQTVTLLVDTKNRDNDVLQKVLARRKEGTSPALRLQLGRDSGQIADSKFPWDDSNGAGWFPRERKFTGTSVVACTGGQWTITQIVGAEGPDEIVKLEMFASISTSYAVAVLDWKITSADLPTNPLTATSDWTRNVTGILYGAGMSGQRCGYWHSGGAATEADGAAVSGAHVDEGSWPIHHSRGTPEGVGDGDNSGSPALLWVAVYPLATANFRGRLYHGTE